MFRHCENSQKDILHVGVGSIISAGKSRYLIIAYNVNGFPIVDVPKGDSASKDTNMVKLLNLESFVLEGKGTSVADIHYLSINEFIELIRTLPFSSTDCTFNNLGLKCGESQS